MADDNDDLVMESTTDTPEQIADGLGVEYEAAQETDAVEAAADGAAEAVVDPEQAEAAEVEPADVVEPAEGDEEEAEAEPKAEVTLHPHRGTAPRKSPRPQRKTVDGAAAAARRKSSSEARELREENERLRRELAGAKPTTTSTVHPTVARRAASTVAAVKPEDVSADHPRLKAIEEKLTALGAKPKQEDFDDFAAFEEAKDAWTENRAVFKARALSLRDEIARDETDANREAAVRAAETADGYARSLALTKRRHADYDAVMNKAKDEKLTVSEHMSTAIMEAGDLGAEILYYLATHPKENDRINTLTPHRQVAEVGIIEGRLSASLQSERRPGDSSQRPGARVTRAPEPQRHLIGDMSSTGKTRDLNDPTLSQQEYNRLRDEQDRDSGRMTH